MIKRRKITHDVESLIPALVDKLECLPEVEVVYLYGSRASGTVSPLSDVDLAVLVSSKLNGDQRFDFHLKLVGMATEILRTDEADVQILNDLPLQAQYSVLRNRKLLFSRDDSRRIEFETTVVSLYLDLKPFLEEQYKTMHKRIEERERTSS